MTTTKIVICCKHGGFGLSDEAILYYAKLSGLNLFKIVNPNIPCITRGKNTTPGYYYIDGILDDKHYFDDTEIDRDDPKLVETVEKLGKKCSTSLSKLKIVEIPNDVKWFIDEYDGKEWVAEISRTWS